MDKKLPNRLWNVRFIHLLAIEMAFQFGTYIINPITANFALAVGATIAVAGFVSSLNATMAAIVRPLTGLVADAFNKKSLLIISAALYTASAFGCAISEAPFQIGLFRAIQGLAFAFRSIATTSLVPLVVSQDHLGRGVGWLGITSTVACALAPAIGSYMGSTNGYHACFVFSGALFALGLFLALLFPRPTHRTYPKQYGSQADSLPKRETSRFPRISKLLYLPSLRYSILAGCSSFPYGVAVGLLLVVTDSNEIDGAPLFFVAYALAACIAKPLTGRLFDQKGLVVIIIPALLLESASTALLAFASTTWHIALAGALMGSGQASAYSSLQAESVLNVDTSNLGKAANTFFIGPDIGMGFGPLLGGFILQLFGSANLFLFCGALVLADIVLIYIWVLRCPNNKKGS